MKWIKGLEEKMPEPEFYDEDEPLMDDVCPNCGHEYDEIDFEYQICHYCYFNNNKNQQH
jgi:hypothetical protein